MAHVRRNRGARVIEVDDAFVELFGHERDDVIGRRLLDFVHHEDRASLVQHWTRVLGDPLATTVTRTRLRRADGTLRWVEMVDRNALAEHGSVDAELIDVTAEVEAREQLRARDHLLERLTDSLPVGVAQIDQHRGITYVNRRLYDLLGLPRSAPFDAIAAAVQQRDFERLSTAIREVLQHGHDQHLEVTLVRADGDERACALLARPLFDDHQRVTAVLVTVDDVTDARRIGDELVRRTTTDALSGCLNRSSVIDALHRTLVTVPVRARTRQGTALVAADIDGFRAVNERHGHAAGDLLLGAVGEILRSVVRPADVVGRFGSDEFIVVCPHVADPVEAMAIATRIAEALATEIDHDGAGLVLSASVGLTWTGADDDDPDVLITEAAAAMDEARRSRSSRPVIAEAALTRALAPDLDDIT